MSNKLTLKGFLDRMFQPPSGDSPQKPTKHSCGDKQGCSDTPCSQPATNTNDLFSKKLDRRKAIGSLGAGAAAGAAVLQTSCSIVPDEKEREKASLNWEEYFKSNYRVMNETEREATIKRLERLSELNTGQSVSVSAAPARDGVLYGYAFNISKCRGYLDCVEACVKENNQDRDTEMQYIRIFEMKKGNMLLESGNAKFHHEVPVEGHFYMGVQCYQCENPPCVEVCPVGATWKEKDGIVVVDYDWCIGCRYCQAACPYFGRRFNWKAPNVPEEELNRNQHYLGNRPRKKGVMEKCTFCIHRTREGRQPACVEACPTGARIFGNLLDPQSEIRYVLENKKVFRLKEELSTEPKFWYYMD